MVSGWVCYFCVMSVDVYYCDGLCIWGSSSSELVFVGERIVLVELRGI